MRRRAGWIGWLASTILVWPAVSRLFQPGYVATYDGIWHLSRLIDVDALMRQGELYPRWLPDAGLGHGLPIFNYFPPLTYWLAELPALAGASLTMALQISGVASFLVGAWGMYLLARSFKANVWTSVLAAGVFTYFPFHLQDAYSRGAFPELWGLAWLPWACWALLDLIRQATAVRLVLCAAAGAAVITSHNVMALEGLPAAALLAAAAGWRGWRVTLPRLAAGGAGMLALAAGYWLPAFAELSLTHVHELEASSWRDTTFPVAQLVSGQLLAHYGDQIYQIHWPQALLAGGLLAALAILAATRKPRPTAAVAMGLTLVLLVLLLSRASIPFWEHAPLAGFTQFPWRLLAVIGFIQAALLALVGVESPVAVLPLVPMAALMAWSGLGAIPPSRFPEPAVSGPTALLKQEYGSGSDGRVVDSEYLPLSASSGVLKYGHGPQLEATPNAAPLAVSELRVGGGAWEARVSARQATVLRLQPFYFPGWSVRLDGRPAAVHPSAPAGFLELAVPAGNHRVQATYGGTGWERSATWASAAALLACLAVLAAAKSTRPLAAACTVAGCAVLIAGTRARGLQTPRAVSWSPPGEAQLVAVQAPTITEAGIDAGVYWLVSQPGVPAFDFVARNAHGIELKRWPAVQAAVLPNEYTAPNELELKRYLLTGIQNLPAGPVTITLEGTGGTQVAGEVEIPPQLPRTSISLPLADKLVLAGYRVDRLRDGPGMHPDPLPGKADASAYPGDFLLATFAWQVKQPIDREFETFVHLIDVNGHTWASQDNQPDATLNPTSAWVAGSTVTDRYLLRLADDAPPGLYRLEVGMYRDSGGTFLSINGGRSGLIGSVKVRPKTLPPAPGENSPRWQEPIALAGWSLSQDGPNLRLTFDWAATGSVSKDYTLFVHLVDSSGKVAYQADSPPQQGLFPTRFWETGDRVRDVHSVERPAPGRYQLEIGWYDAATGRRLPLASGPDALSLGPVSVAG